MTALVEPPGRSLTVAEYAELGEDDQCRWELQEGNLVTSPSPSPDHMLASYEICDQLKAQLPDTVVVIQDVDIDLQLSRRDQPGTSRRPDLVVVERAALQRVRTEGGLLLAAETLLVVEIVSPGSRRTDHMIKRAEYADAGIPYYWIIDLEPAGTVSLRACHQSEGAWAIAAEDTRSAAPDAATPSGLMSRFMLHPISRGHFVKGRHYARNRAPHRGLGDIRTKVRRLK